MIDEDLLKQFIFETIKACKKGDSKDGKKICLYSKSTGKLLGRHRSRKSAKRQERAIKANS